MEGTIVVNNGDGAGEEADEDNGNCLYSTPAIISYIAIPAIAILATCFYNLKS